jgi:hypothetical protein
MAVDLVESDRFWGRADFHPIFFQTEFFAKSGVALSVDAAAVIFPNYRDTNRFMEPNRE